MSERAQQPVSRRFEPKVRPASQIPDPPMSALQWMRHRIWVRGEMDRPTAVAEVSEWGDGFRQGYEMAMMKVYGRIFQTEEERVEGERVRREMFA